MTPQVTPHATLLKFGYPNTVVFKTSHWCVMLRPAQATLGALVLCAFSDKQALHELPIRAFEELKICTSRIASALTSFRPYQKINYLALMMVDPHVHFHVLPRYAEAQEFEGTLFPDKGWPGMPDLGATPETSSGLRVHLQQAIMSAFENET
jgi:diadenosine tetraphosphate (Ap4A) HIT family hydrolase